MPNLEQILQSEYLYLKCIQVIEKVNTENHAQILSRFSIYSHVMLIIQK